MGLLVAAVVWISEFAHWYVRPQHIDDRMLQTARVSPSDVQLEEIAKMTLAATRPDNDQRRTLQRTDEIMRGSVSFAGYDPVQIQHPFAADDLGKGPLLTQTDLKTGWQETAEKVAKLNRALRGWANYFQVDTTSQAHRALNNSTAPRLRRYLRNKYKLRRRRGGSYRPHSGGVIVVQSTETAETLKQEVLI
jgi:hypothetical protein